MERVLEFLKNATVYFLATSEDSTPHIRPFDTINMFEDRLYIQTCSEKDVSRQIHDNPNVAICAYYDNKWIRISTTLELDENKEAKSSMLEAYPNLQPLYSPNDGIMEVFYMTHVHAEICEFDQENIVIEWE